MYVGMYVRMYVCMYVRMDGWMDGWMYVCFFPCLSCSRYQLVVMKLTENPDDSGPVLPLQDPNSYEEKDILSYDEAMKSQSPHPYIAAEMNASAFSEDLALFVVGHPGDSLTVANEIYKNGPLSPSSYYSVFLRAFWSEPPQVDSPCIITPQNLRPADQNVPCSIQGQRDYSYSRSSPWSQYVKSK